MCCYGVQTCVGRYQFQIKSLPSCRLNTRASYFIIRRDCKVFRYIIAWCYFFVAIFYSAVKIHRNNIHSQRICTKNKYYLKKPDAYARSWNIPGFEKAIVLKSWSKKPQAMFSKTPCVSFKIQWWHTIPLSRTRVKLPHSAQLRIHT